MGGGWLCANTDESGKQVSRYKKQQADEYL
jgi:hypothetical protein